MSVGALQLRAAWAEDRALLRSNPSADPGAKTGARARCLCLVLLSVRVLHRLRDWHECDKPSRHDAVIFCTGSTSATRRQFQFTVNQDTHPGALCWPEATPTRTEEVS
jgi:hypothetical protein